MAYHILSREMRGVGRVSIDLRLVFFKASFLYVFHKRISPSVTNARGLFLCNRKLVIGIVVVENCVCQEILIGDLSRVNKLNHFF